jgi:hypothetical protein
MRSFCTCSSVRFCTPGTEPGEGLVRAGGLRRLLGLEGTPDLNLTVELRFGLELLLKASHLALQLPYRL